jgi:DNA-binding NarL/FixJ family response regulator
VVTRVAVQQRQRLFREGIAQLLEAEGDIELVGTAATADELLELCVEHRPEVAVLEADTSDWKPGQLARSLRRSVPGVRLVGLSTGDLPAAEIARAQRHGMREVVPRSAGIGQILAALRATSPVRYLRPDAGGPRHGSVTDLDGLTLTSRELTILNLVGAGFTSRAISAQLAISHKTVENHKQRIFAKLGVQNQAHAVSVAMRRGLMRPEPVARLALAD